MRSTLVVAQCRADTALTFCCSGGGPRQPWSSGLAPVSSLHSLLLLPPLSPTLIGHVASVDVKQNYSFIQNLRAQELCEIQGGRPGFLVTNSPYGLCGRKATLKTRCLKTSSLTEERNDKTRAIPTAECPAVIGEDDGVDFQRH